MVELNDGDTEKIMTYESKTDRRESKTETFHTRRFMETERDPIPW